VASIRSSTSDGQTSVWRSGGKGGQLVTTQPLEFRQSAVQPGSGTINTESLGSARTREQRDLDGTVHSSIPGDKTTTVTRTTHPDGRVEVKSEAGGETTHRWSLERGGDRALTKATLPNGEVWTRGSKPGSWNVQSKAGSMR